MDGGWSEWSQFTACSETCGDGAKSRVRDCNNPSPLYGGEKCPGERIEIVECNLGHCKSEKSDLNINRTVHTTISRPGTRTVDEMV